MNLNFLPWIIAFAVISVVAFVLLVRSKEQAEKAPKLGFKEGLGWGIIGLGLLEVLMPYASSLIASPKNDPVSILSGAFYTLGLFIILAGVALVLAKEATT